MFIWLLAGMFGALLEIAPAETVDQIERLQQWLTAVSEHEPGTGHASVDLVSSWSTSELESLFPYVKALVELVGQDEIKPGWDVFTGVEKQLLENLAGQARGNDVNRVVKRGALLHSDIAMMAQADNAPGPPPGPPARFSRIGPRFFVPRRPTVIADDARYETFGREAIHWDYARMLLDSVRPSPSSDRMVRRWYHAIAAYFAGRYLLAQSLTHLERAQQLFPGDPALLLDRGCLHETFAAPRVQTVVQMTTLPYGRRITVAGASANLRDAERYFRRALASNPDMTEARVRLARVLSLRDRPERARTELQGAITRTSDSLLLYYSHLFLADAEQALGRVDAAREAYERASALYPRAQSPHLGLSDLARRRGDRSAALQAIEQVLSLPADEHERDDPWWDYHEGTGRHADALLAELRAPFRQGRQ
jgi:tetratricopeptide (TPR) repeat protein